MGVASLMVGLGLSALLTYAGAWFHDWLTMALTLFFLAGGVITLKHRTPPGVSVPHRPVLAAMMFVGWLGAFMLYLSFGNLARLPIESAAAHRYDAAPDCQARTPASGAECVAQPMTVTRVYGHTCVELADERQRLSMYCVVNTSWANVSPSMWHSIGAGDSVIAQTASGHPMAFWLPRSGGRVIRTRENPDVVFTRHFEECYMILLTLLIILLAPLGQAFASRLPAA